MTAQKKCPNYNGAGYLAGKQGNSIANLPCPICSEKGMIEQNSLKQVNDNYARWKNARDVEKAFEDYYKNLENEGLRFEAHMSKDSLTAFALYFAQRCGVVFTESINEKQQQMEALSKQIEEAILDGINTYKELAAIGRGFDITSFSKICANQIVFEKECKRGVYECLTKTVRK